MADTELPSYMANVQKWLGDDKNSKVISDLRRATAVRDFEIRQVEVQKNAELLALVRKQVASCSGFWPYAIMQNSEIGRLTAMADDQDALSYLTDIDLQMDASDPREYAIVFSFKENPYFSNSTLTKKYVFAQPNTAKATPGQITDEVLEFDAEEDLKPVKETINWKSDAVNLLKKYGRSLPEDADDEDEMDGDIGSFFWWFDDERDPLQIGATFVDNLLPRIVDHFLGLAGDTDDEDAEFDSDDEDDDGEDEDEIDLEEEEARPSKKVKRS